MADIVLVNPSANMKVLGQELRAFGNNVAYANTSEFPRFGSRRVFYFFAGYNACFTTESQGELEKEDRIFLFKRGLIARFRMWNITKTLIALNPDLSCGNFRDLLMFKRGMLKHDEHVEESISYNDLSAVNAAQSGAKIVSAYTAGGQYKLCRWETDLDLSVTLGDDYFVFFSGKNRIEAFSHEGLLYTFSKSKDHAAGIVEIIPMLNKFSFKLIDEKSIGINTNPWVLKQGNLYHINDYSFGRTSVSMPSGWYDKLAAYLNFDKKK